MALFAFSCGSVNKKAAECACKRAQLDKKITEIKNNWNDYEPMVESAYKKVVEKYNTKYIFEKIKNGEPIE